MLAARREDKLEELKLKLQVTIRTSTLLLNLIYQLQKTRMSFISRCKGYELETFINNAGFGDFSLIADQDLNKVEKMLHLNIEALTILSSLFVKIMKTLKAHSLSIFLQEQAITCFTSITYSATKFYVSAFTEGIARN
ncbi:SDR family NAD(P)-dependent oxidoreductase [Bacillus megaterium NBRC 15308 = ATCC 14581]|nr:SDR family NAD(P)-dependent oxidoreductase [Priestia megaterium NBRC 15308 = ATCC 14581]